MIALRSFASTAHFIFGLGFVSLCVSLCVAPPARSAESVTVVATPGGGQPIVARCDAAGTIHLLYDSAAGPHYARSTDNGRTFGDPVAVVDEASRRPGLVYSAWDMAIGQNNMVHVALSTNAWKLKLPQEEWAYFHARLAPGASAFSPVRNVNKKPSEGFSLAADDRGTVTACWLSGKLYANVSHDNGETFGPNVEIDSQFNPCDCCTTTCAYSADGTLAVLYREETNDQRDMYLVLWNQARGSMSRTRVSTTDWHIAACPMTYYSVTPTADGFVAAWPTKGQIYLARLDRQGQLLPPGEVKTTGMSGMRTGIQALTNAAGNTLVAWKKDGELGWQLFDKQGQSIGQPGAAKSAGKGAAGVVSRDGRFVLFR